MAKEKTVKIVLENHTGCFGNFNASNPLCMRLCALRLRCAIERDQKEREEMLEELFDPGELDLNLHQN
jgi:hypothetical protein